MLHVSKMPAALVGTLIAALCTALAPSAHAAVTAGAAPVSLLPASAQALISCDGTDVNSCDGLWPKDTICASDGEIAETATKEVTDPLTGEADTVIANLWYSPTCHSVWGQILTNALDGFDTAPSPGVEAYNPNGSNPSQTCSAATIPPGYTDWECSTKMVNDYEITAKAKATGYTDQGTPLVAITAAW